MKVWLRSQSAYSEALPRRDDSRAMPRTFDEKFSYVTVLQEFVQRQSPTLPKYSRTTTGAAHTAKHTAICTYGENATRGSSTRFVWARNAAAFDMLQVLGFFERQK